MSLTGAAYQNMALMKCRFLMEARDGMAQAQTGKGV